MGSGGGVGGDGLPLKVDIGKREVVGFGRTGEEMYIDDVHTPFPAIRFKEDTAEIAVRKKIKEGKCTQWEGGIKGEEMGKFDKSGKREGRCTKINDSDFFV